VDRRRAQQGCQQAVAVVLGQAADSVAGDQAWRLTMAYWHTGQAAPQGPGKE
jgi:hypothetical protein